jgi:hypothetical protein
MYKVQMGSTSSLTVTGHPTPLPKTITLASGWNFLACPHQSAERLRIGLPSASYTHGDQLKSQLSFSMYYSNFGWYGTLKTIQPGDGYMLNFAEGGQAIFQGLRR